jgi:hypothetical protein
MEPQKQVSSIVNYEAGTFERDVNQHPAIQKFLCQEREPVLTPSSQ